MKDMIWALSLNPMRGRTEERRPVARAATKDALEEYIVRERVPEYSDVGDNSNFPGEPYTYKKVFRKGGPLEWYNFPLQPEPAGNHFQEIPSEAMWVENARAEWQQQVGCLPDVSDVS